MDPLSPDPASGQEPDPPPPLSGPLHRRFIVAMLVYAALAVLAAFRLEGRPRLVVWMFLGLFAIKTLLVVLKQRAD
jgi:hypothetical protein